MFYEVCSKMSPWPCWCWGPPWWWGWPLDPTLVAGEVRKKFQMTNITMPKNFSFMKYAEKSVPGTKNYNPLWPYWFGLCLTRNVRFTYQGGGCCFSMKLKKSNFIFGKQAVDRATNPFYEIWITALCSTFTSHILLMSQGSKFTACYCV